MKIMINGVRLYVDVDGAGLVPEGATMQQRPTILFLHGGPGMDHSSFKSDLSPLKDIAQLVYVDHRGNGRSDPGNKKDWTLDQWADDVKTLCDMLGVEKPIVMGQSFGGFVAQAYGTKYPDHPGKLIISSTSAKMRLDRSYDKFEELGGKAARDVAQAFFENPCEETRAPYFAKNFNLYNPTVDRDPKASARIVMNPDMTFHFFRGELHDFDFREGLGGIKCPTLVLGGEEDPITPIQDQIDIAAALPQNLVRFERFANAGHGAYRDHPEKVMNVIREFVLE